MSFCIPAAFLLVVLTSLVKVFDAAGVTEPFGIWFADKLLPAAILAIAISWFIPRAMERYRGRRDQLYKLTDTVRDQIQAYQVAATLYWLTPQTAASAMKAEANLDFLLKDIGLLIRLMSKMGVTDLWGTPDAAGVQAVANLMAATTSYDRIVKTRKPDQSRVTAINDSAIHLTSLILHRRWDALKKA